MKKIAIILLAALMLLAISCEEQPQHEHKFLEEWKNNETQHWHECECKEKSEVADHEFETITVESTCTKKGSETVKCKVCGYVVSSTPIPCVPHTWGEWELDSEAKLKTRVCTICETSETSETKSLTTDVLDAAIAYDNLIGNVSGEDMNAVMSIDEEARVLSSGKQYDVRNLKSYITGECSFEVKLASEENYHTYSFKRIGMGEITDVVIDDVSQGEGYNAEEDPCIDAYYVYMDTSESQKTYVKIENASVTSGEETYSMSFESEYDSTKDFETRYMKITDNTGEVKLEYSLNLVGPHGMPEPISELVAKGGVISEAEAVGLFIVDGEPYDIDSVNKAIAAMF